MAAQMTASKERVDTTTTVYRKTLLDFNYQAIKECLDLGANPSYLPADTTSQGINDILTSIGHRVFLCSKPRARDKHPDAPIRLIIRELVRFRKSSSARISFLWSFDNALAIIQLLLEYGASPNMNFEVYDSYCSMHRKHHEEMNLDMIRNLISLYDYGDKKLVTDIYKSLFEAGMDLENQFNLVVFYAKSALKLPRNCLSSTFFFTSDSAKGFLDIYDKNQNAALVAVPIKLLTKRFCQSQEPFDASVLDIIVAYLDVTPSSIKDFKEMFFSPSDVIDQGPRIFSFFARQLSVLHPQTIKRHNNDNEVGAGESNKRLRQS